MQHQQGFSLLEVLIALAILSLGLLGFAEAQLVALQQDQQAYLQSLTTQQLSNMAERLRACSVGNHILTTCLTREISRWQKENKQLFPQAESQVIQKNNFYQLKIQWQIRSRSESSHHINFSQDVLP